MGLKVAASCLQWSPQPTVPHAPPSQTSASAMPSPSSSQPKRRCLDGVLSCRYCHRSCNFHMKKSRLRIARKPSAAAKLDSSSQEEEFSRRIQELSSRLHSARNSKPFDGLEPPKFPGKEAMVLANGVDIPASLRKKQREEGRTDAPGCSSIRRAFSSMVFIVQEVHGYSLRMREILFREDMRGIVSAVREEMRASFVWLFQKVFAHTPALMLYLMILLANYSVHSVCAATLAAAPPCVAAEEHGLHEEKFDDPLLSSTASVAGGGSGTHRAVVSGTDGEGSFEGSDRHLSITPDGGSVEEEAALWDSIVEEASTLRHGTLDNEVVQGFLSLVEATGIGDDGEDHSEQLRTELLYQTELAEEPDNPLLLANYAQFLFLVAHDNDRAEDYFRRATKAAPKDAEALNKYANFLWVARNDLWAAEEAYLEAISTEPNNSYYAANYAHFLWNTGGEDTCFPLDSPDSHKDA